MFGWRRRNEGFEWQEYVRTTVLVRRADRQRKLDDARLAALDKVYEARDRGLDAGRAGVNVVSDRATSLAARLAHLLWRGVLSAWRLSLAGISVALAFLRRSLQRVRQTIIDADLIQYLPERQGRRVGAWFSGSVVTKLKSVAGIAAKAAAALVVVVVGGQALQGESSLSLSALTPSLPALPTFSSPAETLTGSATALSGDRLKIADQIIRLAGIDAPEEAQRCQRANGKSWRCGRSARQMLRRLTRSGPTTCTIDGRDDTGVATARCVVDDVDLSAKLVRDGHVFAQSGILSTFGAEEAVAREAKRGVWNGESLHPSEWRDEKWNAAKADAPDGCPIRGYTRASNKVYVMPWSSSYPDRRRSRKVRKSITWFCSEQEAQAAGYQPKDST